MAPPLDVVVEDILAAIAQTQSFIASMTFEQYIADVKTQRAVERCLEIISEASRRFPQHFKDQHQEICGAT